MWQKLGDFNQEGDDASKLTEKQLMKLNRYQKFEKLFPFYLMDVNGFMHLVQKGAKQENPEMKIWHIKTISIQALATAFNKHDSWKDLKSMESDFVKFLMSVCCDDEDTSKLSIFKLRLIGILWCDGDKTEKVVELFECMQDHDNPSISAHDKDFEANIFQLYDFALRMVFENEPKYMNTSQRVAETKI